MPTWPMQERKGGRRAGQGWGGEEDYDEARPRLGVRSVVHPRDFQACQASCLENGNTKEKGCYSLKVKEKDGCSRNEQEKDLG